MKSINIHNYEAYLLDYSDGNLTNETIVELETFLMQHPELKINLGDLDFAPLSIEEIEFSNKKSLKKPEPVLIKEEQYIAYIENQLTETEKQKLEKLFNKNPLLNKELQLYKSTINLADKTVVYPKKEELKRKPKIIWFDFSVKYLAVAASILLLVGAFVIWKNMKTVTNLPEIALINNQTDTVLEPQKKVINPNSVVLPINPNLRVNNILPKNKTINKTSKVTIPKNIPNNITVNVVNTIKRDSTINNLALHTNTLKDTIKKEIKSQNEALVKNTSNYNTIVDVITEEEENTEPNTKQKKGIWSLVSTALNKLNSLGVKAVDGEEKNDNTLYAITLGGVSVQHHKAN